ncbi:MAG TPA: outer membrane protein transport protein [Vicinamibacteria bacterium]|nr:outer membrane protein transport protein [Vicinamibacteria bacterium]
MSLAVRGRAQRALLALPLLAFPAAVHASGFALESQGARAMGFAGAYVAQSSDPSAIYYNAAGIGFLKGKQLYVGGAFASLSTQFTGSGPNPPAGTIETSDVGLGLLPSLYYSQQVGEKTVIGLGVYRPFATHSKWDNPDSFTGRYICVDCQIQSWSINPTIAYKLADRFAVGVGLDVRLSDFRLARRLAANPNPFPQPKDVAELTLDSSTRTAVGFDVGILASPNENLSIGLSYRHKVTVDHAAQANFVQILTGDAAVDSAVAAALPASQPTTATFTYPGSFAAGIAFRRGYWTVEGDVQWMFWSSFDNVAITFASSPAYDTVLPQNWTSTWRGALGVEYLIGNDWEVRGGFGYDHSPSPTPTISPFIHDADRYTFGGGGSWKYERLRIDFNVRYVAFRGSSTLGISQYGYDGSYETHSLQLGASIGYRF